jgi:phosphoglycerate dehydrogenase-like enzyme
MREFLKTADGCITGWGTPLLTASMLADAHKLKIITHAAGTVKFVITDAVWDKNIVVTSSAAAIAVDVAETTLGLMIVSMKRIWQLVPFTRSGGFYGAEREQSHEMNGKTIGIIGASHVGRRVIELLASFNVKIQLYDPYMSEEQALRLGAIKVDLNTLLKTSDIVSLHAPSTAETQQMLNAQNLPLLKDGAILINTSRGALIDEPALVKELETGRIMACLDVFDPEPPVADSPFRKLNNVILTPHIAGCINNCSRLGTYAANEMFRFFVGKPLVYQVTREMLSRIG